MSSRPLPITATLLVHAPGPAPEHAPPSPSSDGGDSSIREHSSHSSITGTLRPSIVKATAAAAAAAAAALKKVVAPRPKVSDLQKDVPAADAAAGSQQAPPVRVKAGLELEEGEAAAAPVSTPGVDDGGGGVRRQLLARIKKPRNPVGKEQPSVSVSCGCLPLDI